MDYDKNHFIPEFYIKQWYHSKDVGLFAFNYNKNTKLFHSIKGQQTHGNIEIWKYHLYSKDKDKRISLEKAFGKMEDKVSRILKKLNTVEHSVDNINTTEKVSLLLFILHLRIRSPHVINDKMKEIENSLKCQFLKNGGTFSEYYHITSNTEILNEIINLSLSVLEGDFDKFAISFLNKYFKNAQIVIADVRKSHYSLLSSNFPIIDYTNLFSKEGYDIIFPLSPNILFLLISEASLNEYNRIKQTSTMENFIINTNAAMLINNKNRDLTLKYQIYSKVKNLECILPQNKILEYFYTQDAVH